MSIPKHLIFTLPKDLINLYTSFLGRKDLLALKWGSKACSNDHEDQWRAAELLHYVLNIDEEKKKRILELINKPSLGSQSFILIKAQGFVEYNSSKQKKVIPRAQFNNVSPLEAAALCGDFFLVQLLSDAVPKNQKHSAGLQLQEIRKRSDFLAPFPTLVKAYHEYNIHLKKVQRFKGLDFLTHIQIEKELREQIGESQKKISNYGLQVFCNLVTHDPLPDFTIEPLRKCIMWDKSDLDLDSIGIGTDSILHKGPNICTTLGRWAGGNIQFDPEAIALLYKVIQIKLGDIMDSLLDLTSIQPKKYKASQGS